MASVYYTGYSAGVTQSNIFATRTGNKTSTVARSAGSAAQAPNYTTTPVQRPATGMIGTSNQQITDATIVATTPQGAAITYTSGTVYNSTIHTTAKNINVTVANANFNPTAGTTNYLGSNSDPLHDKILDRQVITTGYYQLRDGRWVNSANGSVVAFSGMTSATGFYGLTSAGDENSKNQFNGVAQDYNYRQGLTNVDKSLNLRTG